MSTDVVEAVVRVHGGVKFYRGAAKAARAYVERDRSRADDYYLGEGTGVAAGSPRPRTGRSRQPGRWTARPTSSGSPGSTSTPGSKKGRVRDDANALRFVEVTVNGPKTWSLAAALHPEISAALDAAQDRPPTEIVGWVAEHATTRVGPRGRQVQVPVEQIEAAVIRHYTSRAGDPHRHLHLQINARVFAAGAWRGHPLGRDARQHRGDQRDRSRRRRDRPGSSGRSSRRTGSPSTRRPARSASSRRTSVRSAPGPRRSAATSTATKPPGAASIPARSLVRGSARRGTGGRGQKPDPTRSSPRTARELVARWNGELRDLGYRDPTEAVALAGTRPGWIDRDAAAELVVSILGAKRSAWNTADIRGKTEVLLAQTCLLADPAARIELAEDITARAADRCVRLLTRADVPEHVRCLTSPQVLEVEADVVARLARRAAQPARKVRSAGADWSGSTRPKPPWSAPWPATGRWWWSKVPPVPGRPPPCGRLRNCCPGGAIG